LYGIAMRYGKGFRTSFFTVILVIGLGFVFSLLSRSPSPSSDASLPPYSAKQISILQRYLDCVPYIGYERLYDAWRMEAKTALDMDIVIAPVYRAKNLASSLAPGLGLGPKDRELINFAMILVMREDLIKWYKEHLDKESFFSFQKTHVGYLHWNENGSCIDYSFIPISALPYRLRDIDIKATWDTARLMGIDVAGYVDGVYIEKVLYKR